MNQQTIADILRKLRADVARRTHEELHHTVESNAFADPATRTFQQSFAVAGFAIAAAMDELRNFIPVMTDVLLELREAAGEPAWRKVEERLKGLELTTEDVLSALSTAWALAKDQTEDFYKPGPELESRITGVAELVYARTALDRVHAAPERAHLEQLISDRDAQRAAPQVQAGGFPN